MSEKGIYDKALEAAAYITSKTNLQPEIAVVLGSGLGDFADTLEDLVKIPFEDIPYFKKSTIVGHAGKLVIGKVSGKVVACMQGRYHFYEGYSMSDVVFPARVFKVLGIKIMVVTNAAGGINKMLAPGDLMIIRDHINFLGTNPLIGPNDDRFGPRFPDCSNVYNTELSNIVAAELQKLGMGVKRGVYIATTGPCYETPQEIQMFLRMGADAVGMSTVPEALVANHMGIKVCGISCVTNFAAGILNQPLNHKEVIETAERVKEQFKQLIKNILAEF